MFLDGGHAQSCNPYPGLNVNSVSMTARVFTHEGILGACTAVAVVAMAIAMAAVMEVLMGALMKGGVLRS